MNQLNMPKTSSKKIYIPKRKKALEWTRKAVEILYKTYIFNKFRTDEAEKLLSMYPEIPNFPIMKLSQYNLIKLTGYGKRLYDGKVVGGMVGEFRLKRETVKYLLGI